MKEVKFVTQGVLVKKNVIADAMETLAEIIKKDPSYRHAWKANISCKIYDSKYNKLSMQKTNEIADDIIKMLFERKQGKWRNQANALSSKGNPTKQVVGSSPTLPTMQKRIVNISQENIFDEVLDKPDVAEILEEITEKWKNKDFSKKVYFDKRPTHGHSSPRHRSGTIQFIKAYKLHLSQKDVE